MDNLFRDSTMILKNQKTSKTTPKSTHFTHQTNATPPKTPPSTPNPLREGGRTLYIFNKVINTVY